jgi:peroxiredoxin
MRRDCSFFLAGFLLAGLTGVAQAQVKLSADETAIEKKMGGLRSTPDADRGQVTRQIAMDIRALPIGGNKVLLANGLANLSTEGDFGHNTLQTVADTLALALHESPEAAKNAPDSAYAYMELAQLQRYEHVRVKLSDPQYAAASEKVANIDQTRANVDFTLTDLDGKTWTRSALAGKVVVVNFWATWCPPCRKEMPDLGELYEKYKDQGLVVLAISDEKDGVVRSYIGQHKVPFTILLDPGRKVNDAYAVDGIPKTFFYDRSGKLVAQAMDMRTRGQFMDLLGRAGIH